MPTICVTILFRFIAGALADRLDKKRIMLVSDFVATSLLVPKKHYTRVGGLQGFSGAVISILAPALGSYLLVFGGMKMVLICDLASFSVAFLVLLLFIKLPKIEYTERNAGEPFLKSCLDGIRYLWEHKVFLHITLFLAVINFFAKLGNDGMLAPFVLGRTGNNQQVLGMVQSSVALGLLAGSFVVAAFASYMAAAVMNANLMAVMREAVPTDMQGRFFSAKDTLQNCTIPLGIFLGGVLADYVFEPFMMAASPTQQVLSIFFGAGKGTGIAFMFFLVGIIGILISLAQLKNPVYKDLEK